jgi:hypothetical protein
LTAWHQLFLKASLAAMAAVSCGGITAAAAERPQLRCRA